MTIEAASVPLSDGIRDFVGDMSGSVNVAVLISFPAKDLKCTTGTPKVFNCTGATKKASVTITVSKQSMFESSNRQDMRMPVKIQSIDISSASVDQDQLMVKSSMFVKMKGDFQLDLEEVFKNSEECK